MKSQYVVSRVKPVPFLSDRDIMVLSMKTWGLPAKFPLKADAESPWTGGRQKQQPVPRTEYSNIWSLMVSGFVTAVNGHVQLSRFFGILVPETWYEIIGAQTRGLVTLEQFDQRLSQRKWSSPCDSNMATLLGSFFLRSMSIRCLVRSLQHWAVCPELLNYIGPKNPSV